MACIIDSWVPTASMTECAPSPWVSILDAGHDVVAAPGDDVGGAELAGPLLPGLMPAHRDDPLCSQLLGGHFRHPVVGELALAFDAMELPADPCLTLTAYSAEAGSVAEERLALLASWSATLDRAQPAATADSS